MPRRLPIRPGKLLGNFFVLLVANDGANDIVAKMPNTIFFMFTELVLYKSAIFDGLKQISQCKFDLL